MKVKWEVNDGYVCGSRPHYTEIPDAELQDCGTDDERESLIDEYIQEDFTQKITWTRK